eukprot:4136736-Prymnesium_polylepis.1
MTLGSMEAFLDKFTLAATGVPKLLIEGAEMSMGQLSAEEVAATIGESFDESTDVMVVLPAKSEELDKIKVFSSSNQRFVDCVVPSGLTFGDLETALNEQYGGAELRETMLCAPKKNGIVRYKVSTFEKEADVVETIAAKVRAVLLRAVARRSPLWPWLPPPP